MDNYISYLRFIDEKLSKFFDSQKPFIFCKKGCGMCCQNAIFPYSHLEMNYLLAGMMLLSEKEQNIIAQNVTRILDDKKFFKGELFRYTCPFLINDECAVYDYRGVVCRAFGLMTIDKNKKIKVPFCCFDGFNYSNVVDFETEKVSPEKYQTIGCAEEPTGFNVSYEFLTNPDFEKEFNLSFGDKKPLIDWFVNIEG